MIDSDETCIGFFYMQVQRVSLSGFKILTGQNEMVAFLNRDIPESSLCQK